MTPPIGHTAWGAPPGSVVPVDYIYTGVHRLPDERLMCCMHLLPQNWPCIAISEDGGVTVAAELADGRILTVYYLSTAEGDEPVHEQACVRYVAGTLFRLQHLSKAD